MEKDLKLINYPKNLDKLKSLQICSNKLIGGGDLVNIENFVPIIIGNGTLPKIWLTVKIDNKIIEIVKENVSYNNQIIVKSNNNFREVKIYANDLMLITAKLIKDYECVVNHLDLRPIGLNIFGNEKELNVANTKLSGNSFSGAKFLIGM